jgi:hypothetical protein
MPSNPLDITCFAKYRANFANYFVHLQRGYNGVARADSQLPGTAIQIVFAPIAGAAKRGIRAFYIITQFILLLTMTVYRPIEMIFLESCILDSLSGQRSSNKKGIRIRIGVE